MLIEKEEIRRLIPHAGSMCLLDRVLKWDGEGIVCESDTHRERNNPLRRDAKLSAVHAFEYAAQATAVHGGLRAHADGDVAPPGLLVALRNAVLHVTRLDDIKAPLEIRAHRLFGDRANTVYHCQVFAAGSAVAEARVTIMRRN